MPKESLSLNNFEGGLNTWSDPRDIGGENDNQVSAATGVDLSNPVSGAIALAKQSNPGEFIHDVSTSLPELPAVGGFQIGHNPETDIGRRVGQFLQDKAIALGQGIQVKGYEDYQLARDYKELERGIMAMTPSSVPVIQSTTRGG